jgi:hypothetical protein
MSSEDFLLYYFTPSYKPQTQFHKFVTPNSELRTPNFILRFGIKRQPDPENRTPIHLAFHGDLPVMV